MWNYLSAKPHKDDWNWIPAAEKRRIGLANIYLNQTTLNLTPLSRIPLVILSFYSACA